MSKIYPYAGFWRRAVAFLIDSMVIGIGASILYIAILGTQFFNLFVKPPQSQDPQAFVSLLVSMLLFQALVFVLFWLYFALLESGKAQATLGKRVMGIKVVGTDGGRISFWRATGRWFGKMVSNMTLYFGYYMAGFTKKRQALHDLMAGTYVVQKSFQPDGEKPELPFSTGGLIASIAAAVLPVVLMVIIFFATLFIAVSDVDGTDSSADDWEYSPLKTTASIAQARLFIAAINDDMGKPFPAEKDGIAYSKTADGLQADFADEDGQKFTLLLKKDAENACCEQGDCQAIDIDPCK